MVRRLEGMDEVADLLRRARNAGGGVLGGQVSKPKNINSSAIKSSAPIRLAAQLVCVAVLFHVAPGCGRQDRRLNKLQPIMPEVESLGEWWNSKEGFKPAGDVWSEAEGRRVSRKPQIPG